MPCRAGLRPGAPPLPLLCHNSRRAAPRLARPGLETPLNLGQDSGGEGFQPVDVVRLQPLEHNALDASLRQAAAYLDTVAPARRLVIMRDGRMFRHERLDEYRRHVGDAFSFLEVIKHPVPMMLVGARASAPGTVMKPSGGNCYFLMTADSPVSSHINHPLKVRVVHDGLGLGDPKLLDCVLGLCYAPSLGVRPTRSPSPIYWADGVSKISETNHQFSGLNFARAEV